jgi:hypothetical protein
MLGGHVRRRWCLCLHAYGDRGRACASDVSLTHGLWVDEDGSVLARRLQHGRCGGVHDVSCREQQRTRRGHVHVRRRLCHIGRECLAGVPAYAVRVSVAQKRTRIDHAVLLVRCGSVRSGHLQCERRHGVHTYGRERLMWGEAGRGSDRFMGVQRVHLALSRPCPCSRPASVCRPDACGCLIVSLTALCDGTPVCGAGSYGTSPGGFSSASACSCTFSP